MTLNGLRPLSRAVSIVLDALLADKTVTGWFAPVFIETFVGLKRHEAERLAGLDPAAICDLYRTLAAVLIEVRQDLLTNRSGIEEWANRLAAALPAHEAETVS